MTDAPLVEARDIRKHYEVSRGMMRGKDTLRAVDGVSFSLNAGDTLAVVGESGCGKSTLARQLTLVEKPTSGGLLVNGIDVVQLGALERKKYRTGVQMIFQDPFGSLNPRKKVGSILREPLEINTNLSTEQQISDAHHMMDLVGLRPEHYNRYPHMFSGGQRQRIAIARALMLNPRLVVADEPVSALDVSIQAQVLNLMLDLQDEFQLAYVFISHDLSVVRFVADEILVMYLGRPIEQAAAKDLFDNPVHPYPRALIAATPHVSKRDRDERVRLSGEVPSPLDPPPGCAFHTRCPFATEQCAAQRPEMKPFEGRQISCHRAGEI